MAIATARATAEVANANPSLHNSYMRPSQDIEKTIDECGDAVWRICSLHFPHHTDAQDAFQETFLKYALADEKVFSDSEHRKAWLLRVATNACNDIHRQLTRHPESDLDETAAGSLASTDPELQPGGTMFRIIEAMRALDDPPRTPLYLALVEGYSAPEISEMTNSPVNTIYSWISRGKQQLREALS